MADDLSPQVPGRSFNWSLLVRFLMFFVVAGFLFVLFFWVTFLRAIDVDTELKTEATMSNGEKFSTQSYDVAGDDLEITFDGVDVMRFVSGSSFDVLEISEEDGFYTVSLNLVDGGVWVANMGGVLDVMVIAGDFMFRNIDGYYYIGKVDSDVFAYSYRHHLSVHFLDGENNSLNSYSLPEGYYVQLEDGTVSSVVSGLRYAKLVKEYPFYSITDDQSLAFWGGYAAEDDSRYRNLLSDFESLVRQHYGSYMSDSDGYSFVDGIVSFLREYLTFSDAKKQEWAEQDTLTYLNQALYLSVKGEQDDALEKLVLLEQGSIISDEYASYLNYLNVVLNNSLYGDDLYPVKSYLRNLLYGNTDEGNIIVLSQMLAEMYDLVGNGDVASAKQAFAEYERGWWDFLGMSVTDLSQFRTDISEERELLSVLLLQEDGFYDATYFSLLGEFEQAIFRVAISGSDLDEERQAFVSSKIKVVNQLESLLAVNGIDVDDATDLMILLLDDAEALMDEITSEAAILSYFESEFDEGWLVTQFINSVEYSSLGGSFDEKFSEFLKKEQDIEELKSYLQSLHLGSSEDGELTLSEAKKLVYASFDAAGVSYTAIVSVGDSGYRLFEIQGGEVSGISFSAKYDRESELIYDLQAEGISFTTGVHLNSLGEVLFGLTDFGNSSDIETESSTGDNPSDWSYSEEVAISLLVDYLGEFGIKISDANVVSVDVEGDLFSLEGVDLAGSQVDFVVWAGEDIVTYVSVDGVSIDGEYKTFELESLVKDSLSN